MYGMHYCQRFSSHGFHSDTRLMDKYILIGLWKKRGGKVSSVDQIISGAESLRFFPQVGEGYTYQLHVYEDCKASSS